jgi:hypothetical protein
MIGLNFEEQMENKLEVTQTGKTKLVMLSQFQLAVTSLSEIEILCSTHH